jgi:large-conductance mechanosensitive channel
VMLFSVLAFSVGAVFGIWRMGASVNMQRAFYSFFAEPTFTWFSTSAYLIFNDPPLLNIPLNFLTSFFNLVPNTFFSLKPFIVSIYSMVKGYESPLGADSMWGNLVINFGIIGSVLFVFVTGFVLNLLRHLSESSRFAAVYYIMVCGMLPFQFFRDGFYILNKQLFFNFLLLPLIILLVLKTVLYMQHSLSRVNKSRGY